MVALHGCGYGGTMSSWTDEDGVLELPDGRRVRGTGTRKPRGGVRAPEFAVYLLGRDPQIQDWPYRWVRWRDFHLPASTEQAVEVLREAHQRAAGERVEIACGAGNGRTGTALAVLAVMSGVGPEEAVTWVRAHYRRRAVETRWQRRWITQVAAFVGHGGRNSTVTARARVVPAIIDAAIDVADAPESGEPGRG